jgi:hypothetical protein
VIEDVVTDIITSAESLLSDNDCAELHNDNRSDMQTIERSADDSLSANEDNQINNQCPAALINTSTPEYNHSHQKISQCKVVGVKTKSHGQYNAKAIIITSGTSLRGRIFIGHDVQESGGDNRPAANLLSESLENLGFKLIRLKTGTPPRLKSESCDFSKCVEHKGESPAPLFSLRSKCSTWNNCLDKQRSIFNSQNEVQEINNTSLDGKCSTWNNKNSDIIAENTVQKRKCSTWNNVDFDKTVTYSCGRSDPESSSDLPQTGPV